MAVQRQRRWCRKFRWFGKKWRGGDATRAFAHAWLNRPPLISTLPSKSKPQWLHKGVRTKTQKKKESEQRGVENAKEWKRRKKEMEGFAYMHMP
jgi:hypothetical protein